MNTSANIDHVKIKGEFNFPPQDAEIVAIPPQQRTLAPATSAFYPVYKVKGGCVYRNEKYYWETFSAQGAQDLRFRLMVANSYRIYSGEVGSINKQTPPFDQITWIERTRTAPTVGALFNLISNATGTGFHDNFSPYWKEYYQNWYEEDTVIILVQNQSDFLTHSFLFSTYGWSFKLKKEYIKSPGVIQPGRICNV